MADGKPDLSGFWAGGGGGGGARADDQGNLTVLNRSRGCHPGMKICTAPVNQSNDSTFAGRFDANRPLYKPEYWDKVRELDFNSNTVAPYFICQPAGVPRMGPPAKIVQTKDEVILLYAQQGASPTDFRIIPTDGRAHDHIKSQDLLFYGHAVGKWEGDTLVVDAVGFNDLTWLAQGGYFHSDQMRVIERFRRDGNTLHLPGDGHRSRGAPRAVGDEPAGVEAEYQQGSGDSRTEPLRGTGYRAPGRQDPPLGRVG